jgi:hypothetical protein
VIVATSDAITAPQAGGRHRGTLSSHHLCAGDPASGRYRPADVDRLGFLDGCHAILSSDPTNGRPSGGEDRYESWLGPRRRRHRPEPVGLPRREPDGSVSLEREAVDVSACALPIGGGLGPWWGLVDG